MSMTPFSLPRELSNTTNFPNWPNPCGVQMAPISNTTQVKRDQWVPVTFPDVQPPFRVYGVVNNRNALELTWKPKNSQGLKCMMTMDITEGHEFEWKVQARNVTWEERGGVGFDVGDFVWFHAEEIGRNDTDQRKFYTSANFSVVASPGDPTSGSAPTVVGKSGLILLAGAAAAALLSLAC